MSLLGDILHYIEVYNIHTFSCGKAGDFISNNFFDVGIQVDTEWQKDFLLFDCKHFIFDFQYGFKFFLITIHVH